MGVGGKRHAPAAFPPVKRLSTHYTGGWLYLRVGQDGCRKYRLPTPQVIDPRTVQPVASRYTDWAISGREEKHTLTLIILQQ
jgi:hypothetical protein